MTQSFDGNYDYTKPWRAPVQPDQVAKRYSYLGPWASNMERLTQQALMVMNIPGADIQAMVRAPLPQIRLFPDRFGYGDRAPSFLPFAGIHGFVVDETKNTLVIRASEGGKTVPKKGCVFQFTLPDGRKAALDGAKIAYRPYDRPKKMK